MWFSEHASTNDTNQLYQHVQYHQSSLQKCCWKKHIWCSSLPTQRWKNCWYWCVSRWYVAAKRIFINSCCSYSHIDWYRKGFWCFHSFKELHRMHHYGKDFQSPIQSYMKLTLKRGLPHWCTYWCTLIL